MYSLVLTREYTSPALSMEKKSLEGEEGNEFDARGVGVVWSKTPRKGVGPKVRRMFYLQRFVFTIHSFT